MSQYAAFLDSELQCFRIQLPPNQRQLLVRYCEELERWNRKINLTGLRGRDLVRRLIVEPVWVALQLELSGSLVDIGSGNGSPAIPMHIVQGLERIDLVESRFKRAAFLRNAVGSLNLTALKVHRGRFEEVADTLEPPDWITLQAVALDEQLIDSMRKITLPTTKIVWITSGAHPPIPPIGRLEVPETRTEVFLFQLDLS